MRRSLSILFLLTLFGAFYPILKARRRRRRIENVKPSSSEAVSHHEPWLSRFGWGSVFTLFMILVFALALWQSRKFDFRTGLFPWAIGIPVFCLTLVQLIMDLSGTGKKASSTPLAEIGSDLPVEVVNRRTAGIFSWIVGYFVAIWLLGFSVGVPLCTFIHLKIFGREKWPITLVYTASAWAMIYGIFDLVLHVPFPPGQLLVWLGLSSV